MYTREELQKLLAIGDAVVNGVLSALAPLRFAEAKDHRERECAFRMRYRAVVERSMAAARMFPDGLERDDFDSRAVHVLAWDGERPIGTCRLTLPAEGEPLPIEQDFGVKIEQPTVTVEVGRMVIEPSYRGEGHRTFMGLASCGWRCMRARGLTEVVASTPPRLVTLFEALGFVVTALGPTRIHWGEERTPFHCDTLATIPRIQELWTTMGAKD